MRLWIKSGNLNLSIQLQPSKILFTLHLIPYLLTFLSGLLFSLNHPWALSVLPFFLRYSYKNIRQKYLGISLQDIVHCQIGHTYWRLTNRAGQSFLAKSIGKAYRSNWWVIVLLKKVKQNKKLVLILAKDSMTSTEYRNLLLSLWEP